MQKKIKFGGLVVFVINEKKKNKTNLEGWSSLWTMKKKKKKKKKPRGQVVFVINAKKKKKNLEGRSSL